MAYYRKRYTKLGYTAVNRGAKVLVSDPTPVVPKAAIPMEAVIARLKERKKITADLSD